MSDRLVAGDKHYWWPIPSLRTWLTERIPAGARVLDVGAGTYPFDRADVLIDIVDPFRQRQDQKFVAWKIGAEPLPFADKHFDFVYCRHMIEDLADPFSVLREIERVGKAGYIETPSPIAELCRGVDGEEPPWRGYNHHRWIVWREGRKLFLVSKWPCVEYIDAADLNLAELLRSGPDYWNTYHLWQDKIRFVHLDNPTDFSMPFGYVPLLNKAVRESGESTDAFWAVVPRKTFISQIGLNQSAA